MLNRKFLSLSLILGFMFVSVSVFASNLTERNVYGILSENFTGATFYNSQSQDNIGCFAESSYGDWKAVSAVHVTSFTANAKEGNKYWEIIMDKWDSVDTDYPTNYQATVSFFFVNANSTDQSYTRKETDISHFRYLDFWIKPVRGDISNIYVGVGVGTSQTVSVNGCKTLGSLGVLSSDNNWQHVVLDLSTLPSGVNLQRITKCLAFKSINNSLSGNTVFYVDNVVLRTDSTSASFNATLKKIEDMQWQGIPENPTQIVWNNDSVFTSRGWKSCGQYVELDMDMYSWKWTVRLYTNNGAAGRGGMYATVGGKDYVIPLCWRAYNGTLVNDVNANKDTYVIAQAGAPDYNLYDGGRYSSDPSVYPWFYVKDCDDADFSESEDYVTVWDSSRGYHETNPFYWENQWGQSGYTDGFKAFDTVEKKPKIYFGGGFDNAAGGCTYVGNIVIELKYE